MELPINDDELRHIVSALDTQSELYKKLHIIMEIREKNPDGPYKKIAREQFGFVIWNLFFSIWIFLLG